MPADFIISSEHQILFSYGWDVLTFADVMGHRSRVAAHAQFNADLSQIIDFTLVSAIELSADQIASLAQQRVVSEKSRRALVAPSDANYGLSRMFHAYTQSQNVQIFKALDDAAAWIGVSPDFANKMFLQFRAAHGLG